MESSEKNQRTNILQVVKELGTEQLLVQAVYNGHVPRAAQTLACSIIFTLLGTLIGFRIAPDNAVIVSVFLTVLGLMPTFSLLVQREQSAPHLHKTKWYGSFKYGPQLKLALGVLAMFCGVMTVYAAWALVLPNDSLHIKFGLHIKPYLSMRSPDYKPEHFESIFFNNLMVALGVMLLSAFYRIGGALLILVWNASLWGSVFAFFARVQPESETLATSLLQFIKLMSAVLPHTLLEAFAYVMVALAGLVLPRLILRDDQAKAEHWKTLRGMLVLLAAGLILVRLAAAVEVTFAPTVLKAMQL